MSNFSLEALKTGKLNLICSVGLGFLVLYTYGHKKRRNA